MRNEVKAQKRNLADLERWFVALWDVVDMRYESIADYAVRKLPSVIFAEKALEQIAKQLYKCPAQCPMQLRQWCYKQIDRLVEKINRTQKAERKNTKPLVYEQHGDRIFVQLFDSEGNEHIWKFPASWLDTASRLWPCYIRRFPDGRPYVARKVPVVQPDGSRVQTEVVVHRLFLGLGALKRNFEDAGEAESVDGSWLNFCDGNIRLIKGSDLLDYSFSLSGLEHTVADRPLPAKATVTTSREGKSKPFNRHERSVMSFLSGKYPDDQKIIYKN